VARKKKDEIEIIDDEIEEIDNIKHDDLDDIEIEEFITSSRTSKNKDLYEEVEEDKVEVKEKNDKEELIKKIKENTKKKQKNTKSKKTDKEKEEVKDKVEDEDKEDNYIKYKEEDEDKTDSLDKTFLMEIKHKTSTKKELDDSNYLGDLSLSIIKFLVGLCILLLIISIILFKVNSRVVEKVETKTYKEQDTNYVFLGDSITEFYELDDYFIGYNTVNSGIAGNFTTDLLKDLDNRVYIYNPSDVFLLIGTNDLTNNETIEEIAENIKEIVEEINENRKYAKMHIISVLPVNSSVNKKIVSVRDNDDIKELNVLIKKYCDLNDIDYIDLYSKLVDEEDNLNEDYTEDGLHLNDDGYKIVTQELKKYMDRK